MSAGEGKTILVVDDEEHILELLSYNLEQSGYKTLKADSGEEALRILDISQVNLVLLDWMLPGIDGIEVLKRIRSTKRLKKLPVILLTAKSEEINKVVGLEVGADDYICKPFGVYELMARVKAVLRRTKKEAELEEEEVEEDVIVYKGIVMNRTRHTLEVDGKPVTLSKKEFELLYLLVKNQGIVYSRTVLLEKVWGYDYEGETRTVDVHISTLRKKIERDDMHPEIIKTVRGVGYKV